MDMVGFYRETQPEPQGVFRESIRATVRSEAPYPKGEIKKYLESGHPVFDIMETTRDVVGGSFTVAGWPSARLPRGHRRRARRGCVIGRVRRPGGPGRR